MTKDENEAWYVRAEPWKGCPFKCALVVLTKLGQKEAIKIFKEFYKNEALEIEEAVPVPIVKGTIDEPTEDARPASPGPVPVS